MKLRFRRHPRLFCGCRPGKPHKCDTGILVRLVGESVQRAWDGAVREMNPRLRG